MLNLRNISIRNKLILMQVVTSVLVLAIIFTVFIISDIRSYKQRKVDTMMSLAKVIANNSISTLQFEDDKAARDILTELGTVSPEVKHAVIINRDGKIFASMLKPGGTEAIRLSKQPSSYQFLDKRLYVQSNIENGDEVLGKVFMEVELNELSQIKRSKYEIAILLLLVALVFSFLIAVAMQTYISRRLLTLVGVMKEVSRTGNYSARIEDQGKDEISILVQGYNQLMQQVKENQQRKDEFIGIASHELKTPLTSIKGYVELLNMMEDRPQHRKFVDKIASNVNKLEKLIRDLLDVSKIQGGQLELNCKEFDLSQLIDETIDTVQLMSKSHEIKRSEVGSELMIFGDRQRIEQVLVNLLSNAVKYSPGSGRIIVGVLVRESGIEVRIRDFGVGIPVEEQRFIFERFYRTKDTSIHISGFGLGLYICRDIINRHSGKIWVEKETEGSTFCFTLPFTQTEKPINT